jgi:hypothetical protein
MQDCARKQHHCMMDRKKKPQQNGVFLSTITEKKTAGSLYSALSRQTVTMSLLYQGVQGRAYLITVRNGGTTFRNSWPP